MTKVPRLGHAEGSSARVHRRLVGPAASSVLPSTILHRGEIRRFLPSLLVTSAVDLVPAFTRYHKRCINISLDPPHCCVRRFPGEGSGRRRSSRATRRGKAAFSPQQFPPFWANGTPAGHMLKTCHAAEAVSMASAFPPGAHDVFLGC